MRAAAFFDLDKTILTRSSALAFAGPLYRAGLISRGDVARSAYAQLTVITGRVDHETMERIRDQLALTISGWNVQTLQQVIADHLDVVVAPLIFAEARDLIRNHQRAGEAVVIVTSTGLELAGPIGAMLGVEEVLGTRMAVAENHYTGVVEDYMYGPRKAKAIGEFAAAHGIDLERSYAYSDSITDQPMLSAVGHPHAVNPDRRLRRLAADRGWPVHDFRRRRPAPPDASHHVGISLCIVGIAAVTATLIAVGIYRRGWADARPKP